MAEAGMAMTGTPADILLTREKRAEALRATNTLLSLLAADDATMSKCALRELSEKHKQALRCDLEKLHSCLLYISCTIPLRLPCEERLRSSLHRLLTELLAGPGSSKKVPAISKFLGAKDPMASAVSAVQKASISMEALCDHSRGLEVMCGKMEYETVCSLLHNDVDAIECWMTVTGGENSQFCAPVDAVWASLETKISSRFTLSPQSWGTPIQFEACVREVLLRFSGLTNGNVTILGFASFVLLFGPVSDWADNFYEIIYDTPFFAVVNSSDGDGVHPVVWALMNQWKGCYYSMIQQYRSGTFLFHVTPNLSAFQVDYVGVAETAEERDAADVGLPIIRTDLVNVFVNRDGTRRFDFQGQSAASLSDIVRSSSALQIPFDSSFVADWFWSEPVRREAARRVLASKPARTFAVIRMQEGSRVLPELCLLHCVDGEGTVEDHLITKRDENYVFTHGPNEIRGKSLKSLISKLAVQLELLMPCTQVAGGVLREGRVPATPPRAPTARLCDFLLNEMRSSFEHVVPPSDSAIGRTLSDEPMTSPRRLVSPKRKRTSSSSPRSKGGSPRKRDSSCSPTRSMDE